MNSTNRFMNRFLVLLVGVILLAVGVGALLVGTVPQFQRAWASTAPQIAENINSAFTTPTNAPDGIGWLSIATVAALILLIVLLGIYIFRQGHGHTSTLLQEDTPNSGRTVIDSAFAEQSLRSALTDRPELITTSISTYQVRRTPVLKITVTCRRGVSPKDIAELIEGLLRSLDALIGEEVPALIQISGGWRAHLARTTRLQ